MFKTLIFVEDGSVDYDELTGSLGDDTKVIPYRQGGAVPTVLQPEQPIKSSLDLQDAKIYAPTKQALKDILLNYKVNKKVRNIIEKLYNKYYND